MKRFLMVSVLLSAMAGPALAWTVQPEGSSLSYVSIKNGDTGEVNKIAGLSGNVEDDGTAALVLDLATVDTGIDIRNERVKTILFNVAEMPTAGIAAKLNMADFEGLKAGDVAKAEFTVTVTLHGQEVEYDVDAEIARLSDDEVLVSTTAPVLVSAEDFELTAGLDELQKLAGLDSISPVVPVTFTLVLKR